MNRAMLKARYGERGATIIEFGLVAFVFFIIMFGIIEFGRAFYVRNSLQHLTRCMARAAVVIKPSVEADEQLAEKRCLMGTDRTRWPFMTLASEDLIDKGMFRIQYVTNSAVLEASDHDISQGDYDPGSGVRDNSGEPKDPMLACKDDNGDGVGDGTYCIREVRVSVNPTAYESFGLLGAFGIDRAIVLRGATVSMPAEALGL